MAEKGYNSDIEKDAINIVRSEKQRWEEATAFVTERVAFQMRNLIRQLRKNYWGVFDAPTDTMTGRKKVWVPLTESVVEAVTKNNDLDTKDINFRATRPSAVPLTAIVRSRVKNYLDHIDFGEKLDMLIRSIGVDGTKVWKAIETGEDGLDAIKTVEVDLLNCYIDPTAPSIQEAYRFTERALMSKDEIKSMKGWINTDGIQTTNTLSRTDSALSPSSFSIGNYIDVYETWGKIPLNLITGKKSDEKEEIEGHIVVSGLDQGGECRVHLIEKNIKKWRPYEECWYTRVSGRWYGKGVAEKLLMLQTWINTIVNIRILRSYVSQLGLFKIRKGSGITPQMMSRLPANGAIEVSNMEDVEQLVMQEASQASYKDEDNIKDWSQRVTSAFEVVTGESLPSSTPATNAVIQSQNAQSQFILIKEGIGMFLQRWLERHIMPVILKNLTVGTVIQLSDDPEVIREIDDMIVHALIGKELDKQEKAGAIINLDNIAVEEDRVRQRLTQQGGLRFFKLSKTIDPADFGVKVFVTNEELDKSVLSQNLLQMMQIAPEYREQLLRMLMDISGLDSNTLKPAPLPIQAPSASPQGEPNVPGGMVGRPDILPQTGSRPSAQSIMTGAATVGG